MILIAESVDLGRQVWAQHDTQDDIYVMFADQDGTDYLGEEYTLRAAKQFAVEWLRLWTEE